MEFEIMPAGCRPGGPESGPWRSGQATFSVAIRPKAASGRKAAAWVRIVGSVENESGVGAESRRVLAFLNAHHSPALPVRPLMPGLRYRITKAGKAGLRRAT